MKRMIGKILFAAAVMAGGAWAVTGVMAADAPAVSPGSLSTEDGVLRGYTLPYKEYKISFPTMGVVKRLGEREEAGQKRPLKEGDSVKAGEDLMAQDDSEELAELAILAFDKDSTKQVEAADAEFQLAKTKREWAEKLLASGGRNEREVAETQAQEKIAKAKLDLAKQERAQYALKWDKQDKHIKRMTIKSPVDGVVREIINDVGANADPTRPSVTVMQNNPLVVEVHVPALATLSMKKDEKIKVSYDRQKWIEGSIDMLSPKADAGSGSRMIRLSLPNPEGAPSGLQVYVDLRDRLTATAGAK